MHMHDACHSVSEEDLGWGWGGGGRVGGVIKLSELRICAEARTEEFLAAGQAGKATFWPTAHFKSCEMDSQRSLIDQGLCQQGTGPELLYPLHPPHPTSIMNQASLAHSINLSWGDPYFYTHYAAPPPPPPPKGSVRFVQTCFKGEPNRRSNLAWKHWKGANIFICSLCLWLFYQHLYKRKSTFWASYLSSAGCSHVDSLLTNELSNLAFYALSALY